jgi:two-component system, OmpR family, sensor histidine kinase VicK
MALNLDIDPLKDQDGDEHSSLCLYITEYLIVFELLDLTATQDSGEGEEKTEVLYGVENAVRTGVQFMQNARKWMDLFGDKNGPSIIIEFADVYKNNYIGAKRRGAKIRFITEITKDNIHYCKELIEIVDEFRHLEGFTGGIAVSELEYMTTTVLRERQLLTQVFYSNSKEVVEQGQYIFDTFWKKAIPAEQKIKEIEEGIKPEVIETIRDPVEIQMVAFELVNSAKEEILIVFSTANAFLRQVHAGATELLQEAAERDIKVKILTPMNEFVKDIIIQKILGKQKRIEVRYIGESLQSKVSIIVIDRKFSLVVELKDDTKETSYEAVGLATYSNSKPTVSSYASIFESLWIQSELYEQLKVHDKMQKEFIDIAAHELRTPIQPILGLTGVLRSRKGRDKEEEELMDVIIRNARRLQRLTEDILDITRIESQSLHLKKERFDINEVILNAITDSRNHIKRESNYNIKFIYKDRKDISVEADKARIIQVISNLLCNAIKFTNHGTVTISVEEKDNYQIVVSIKDTGIGIDPEIVSRLFSKFATKSNTGTGLGLFISKSIIESHGGMIWAENNPGGEKGAIFYFSLPLGR